jgi:pimeloyl-ACP methyl ester carboxylesterase
VVAYDRAGVGASEPAPTPRTGQEVVKDLHALLMAAQIRVPYVLVGQSFGGYTARLYAHQYPDDVAGMVLVDAPHEDRDSRFLALLPPPAATEAATLTSLRHFLTQSKQDPAQMLEGMDLLATEAQVRATGSLGARPLVVLTAGHEHPVLAALPADVATRVRQLVQDVQRDLASLSSRSRHVIAHESGHEIERDQPDVVIDAIRQVVDAVRGGDQPLAL